MGRRDEATQSVGARREPALRMRLSHCGLEVRLRGAIVERRTFEEGTVRIGAHPDNDVAIDDPTVSRYHCVIEWQGGSWVVRDLDSTNGTWVDGVRVREAYLRSGHVLRLGLDAEIAFEAADRTVEVAPGPRQQLGELVGATPAMRRVMAAVERVARSNVSVVVLGETGTGKEVVARTLHKCSPRARHPFIVVDCAAVPRDLVESELFGHERGAFTGASVSRRGLFEAAHGGTVFIDEIGELSVELQPRLLRVLERREVRRVGANHPVRVDVRVVAATHRNLDAMVDEGRFRADLFFRLGVVRIELPPLRERLDDLPLLAQHLLRRRGVGEPPALSPEALAVMRAYDWPGNVRELAHALEYAAAVADGPRIGPEHLPAHLRGGTRPRIAGDETTAAIVAPRPLPIASERDDLPAFKSAKEQWVALFEREYLVALLSRCGFNVSEAARRAGIDRKHMRNLLRKHGIERSRPSPP